MKLNENLLNEYLGELTSQHMGYSNDSEIRTDAASGGLVSNILIYLLENKYIDGALVSKLKMQNGKITPETFIAKTRKQILDARTSIYFSFPILKNFSLINDFEGKLAVVGLPCQLNAIKTICKNNKNLDKKIVFKIGLFCGHTSNKRLLDLYLQKKKIREEDISKFIFRKGHWRGKTYIDLKNSEKKVYPFQDYSIYQNLFICSERACIHCSDHTAESSDISVGDVWDKKFKKLNIKHSVLLVRNKKSESIIKEMTKKSKLNLKSISKIDVFNAQRRSLIFHKNINARSKIGKYFGFKIKENPKTLIKTRWNDIIAAAIILINIKLSTDRRYAKRFNKILFKMPKPILFIYLVLFKLLTNF